MWKKLQAAKAVGFRARTLASQAYEYYDPEVNSTARPVQLEIRKR